MNVSVWVLFQEKYANRYVLFEHLSNKWPESLIFRWVWKAATFRLKHLGLKSDKHCAGLWQPEKGNTGRTSGRHCWLPSYTLSALISNDIGQVWSFKCAIVQLLDVSNGSFFKIFIIVATWLVLSFSLFIFSSFRLIVFSSFRLFVCSSFRLLVF